ncbi:hypothetical protein ACFV0C_33645 [Streptomyces sp. NPDC059568]|uniref:hypothetical protein n=1 Tax=Streptomyces sp. NPDC059568 TaxID=3346868 RepID=UPI0036925869
MYAETAVDGGFVLRRGVVDRGGDVAEAGDECLDVPFRRGRLPGYRAQSCLGFGLLGLDLVRPSGDGDRVSAGVEGGLVARKLGVALTELLLDPLRLRADVLGVVPGCLGQGCERGFQSVGGECPDEPGVEGADDVGFAEEDVAGVGFLGCREGLLGV